ncbi:MAG: RNA-binding protein [Bdellovibrionales bacterium]|nr:RNA-binding protein [Bdellovibrionales bacterium]
MKKKMYIGNCPFHATEQSLKEFIASCGVDVTDVKVITDRETGRSRGFAFAEIDESADINAAIDAVNGKELEGRALKVSEAREQQPRASHGGGNRDFRGGQGRGGSGKKRY